MGRDKKERNLSIGANDSCVSHSEDTILCSCGYEKSITITSRLKWDKKRIEKEWSIWTQKQRKIYKGFRAFARVHTEDQLLAAQFAAERVQESRQGRRFFEGANESSDKWTHEAEQVGLGIKLRNVHRD